MATNPYFRNMTQKNEQDLSHDLVTEIIQMTGMDVYYIKMESVKSPDFDVLFGENRFEKLQDCFLIEMYPRNFEMPYEGNDLYSKLGLTMNRQVTFEVGYRRIEQVIGSRPREGDYIFIPAVTEREMSDIFKIMYVETDDIEWNPQGTILKYVLKCDQATFGHQELETGIANIDFSVPAFAETTNGDPNAHNDLMQNLGNMFIDFDETHPFGKP